MDTAPWYTEDASILANTEDPFGGENGWKLVEGFGSGQWVEQTIDPTLTAGVYTLSCYAKAGDKSWCSLDGSVNGDDFGHTFDLENGIIGTSTDGVDEGIPIAARIKSVDLVTGWYRISLSIHVPEGADVIWRLSARGGDTMNPLSGSGVDSLFLAFPQFDPYPLVRAYRAAGSEPIL